jgi:carboxypeptidase C (cathepsin A)
MKALFCVLLAVLASGQLLPLQHNEGQGHASMSDLRLPNPANIQHPLSRLEESSYSKTHLPQFKAGNHSIREQDGSTCATKRERQWTGTIDVSDERRLFYWFFDSRSDPVDDPIIIWLNG